MNCVSIRHQRRGYKSKRYCCFSSMSHPWRALSKLHCPPLACRGQPCMPLECMQPLGKGQIACAERERKFRLSIFLKLHYIYVGGNVSLEITPPPSIFTTLHFFHLLSVFYSESKWTTLGFRDGLGSPQHTLDTHTRFLLWLVHKLIDIYCPNGESYYYNKEWIRI